PALLTGLRKIGETTWKELFESLSETHRILSRDPAGAYTRMDFESRARYRNVISELAAQSPHSESQVAEAAIALAEQAAAAAEDSRAAVRRTHVGFYLMDRGVPLLETAIGFRPPWRARLPRLVLKNPTAFYLVTIE